MNKLIDSIVNDLCGFYNTKTQQEYIENILHTHLSDKLILDRKQVEEIMKFIVSIKRNKNTSAGKRYEAECYIKDLQSLLPNKANDS